jgi:hypothetical protein
MAEKYFSRAKMIIGQKNKQKNWILSRDNWFSSQKNNLYFHAKSIIFVVLEGPCVIAGSRNNMLDVDLNFINNIFLFWNQIWYYECGAIFWFFDLSIFAILMWNYIKKQWIVGCLQLCIGWFPIIKQHS